MRTVLEHAARQFVAGDHIRSLLAGAGVPLHDEAGAALPGIRGRIGAAAVAADGQEIGVDLIEMQPGSAFPLHTHPGDHILYVQSGAGAVHVDGREHRVKAGDTIFIPAEYPHGVQGPPPGAAEPIVFLAFGHPHKHVSATDRMKVVA
jgi:quercetin dioxygenase-like cupin family protein